MFRSGSSRNFPGRRAADVGQRVFSQTEPKSHRDFGVFPTFAGISQQRRFAFSLTVRKSAEPAWVLWVGTHHATWQVDNAGFLELR